MIYPYSQQMATSPSTRSQGWEQQEDGNSQYDLGEKGSRAGPRGGYRLIRYNSSNTASEQSTPGGYISLCPTRVRSKRIHKITKYHSGDKEDMQEPTRETQRKTRCSHYRRLQLTWPCVGRWPHHKLMPPGRSTTTAGTDDRTRTTKPASPGYHNIWIRSMEINYWPHIGLRIPCREKDTLSHPPKWAWFRSPSNWNSLCKWYTQQTRVSNKSTKVPFSTGPLGQNSTWSRTEWVDIQGDKRTKLPGTSPPNSDGTGNQSDHREYS